MGTNIRPISSNPVRFDSARPGVARPPESTDDANVRGLFQAAKRLGPHVGWYHTPSGQAIKLRDFAQGSTQLRADYGPALDDAAKLLLESPWRRAFIDGFADVNESPDAKTVQWLARKRAQHVWDALAHRKVPKSQLPEPQGFSSGGGGSMLLLSSGLRRVEVLLYELNLPSNNNVKKPAPRY